MTLWERFWFQIMRFLSAPLLGVRLASRYRERQQAIEMERQATKNLDALHGQTIHLLQRMEQRTAEAGLSLPTSNRVLVEVSRSLMEELLALRRHFFNKIGDPRKDEEKDKEEE